MTEQNDFDWSQLPPSKSQRKRDMIGVQKLGEELTTLSKKQLDKLPLSNELRAAIAEFLRLPNKHEARRRQLQFIGRLMRDVDHESIQQELDRMRTPDRAEVRRAQLIEQWAARLLDGSEDDINAFVDTWPLAERQAIRQILRNHNKENEESARTHRRRLLDYIKAYIE